jgi:hypothetical protein
MAAVRRSSSWIGETVDFVDLRLACRGYAAWWLGWAGGGPRPTTHRVCAARRSSAVQSRNAVSAPASPQSAQSAQMPEARSITSRRVCATRRDLRRGGPGSAMVRLWRAARCSGQARCWWSWQLVPRRRRSIRAVSDLSRVCTLSTPPGTETSWPTGSVVTGGGRGPRTVAEWYRCARVSPFSRALDRVTLAAVAARTAVLQDGPRTALSTYPLWAASVALDGVGTVTLLG